MDFRNRTGAQALHPNRRPARLSNPLRAAAVLAIVALTLGGCADDGLGGYQADEPPVLPCTYEIGEVANWGEGMTPSIAGSDEGYAVIYAAWHDQAGQLRMVAPDGTPTSPHQVMPIDQYDVYAQVTRGRSGYLVNGADIGTVGGPDDIRSVYTLNQSGEILGTIRSWIGLWGYGLASDKLDWVAAIYNVQAGTACPSGRTVQISGMGPAGTVVKIAPYLCLYREGYAWSHLNAGFASLGDGFALGVNHYRTTVMEDGSTIVSGHHLQVVVYDGDRSRTVDLYVLNGTGSLSISKIVPTDDGYAVRWGISRTRDENGQLLSEEEAFLTFLAPNGDIVRTARIPSRFGDIAWNGREIGEASYDRIGQTLYFARYGKDGLPIETVPIATTALHYMAPPRIASANGDYAVVWSDDRAFGNPRPELFFAPIACR